MKKTSCWIKMHRYWLFFDSRKWFSFWLKYIPRRILINRIYIFTSRSSDKLHRWVIILCIIKPRRRHDNALENVKFYIICLPRLIVFAKQESENSSNLSFNLKNTYIGRWKYRSDPVISKTHSTLANKLRRWNSYSTFSQGKVYIRVL